MVGYRHGHVQDLYIKDTGASRGSQPFSQQLALAVVPGIHSLLSEKSRLCSPLLVFPSLNRCLQVVFFAKRTLLNFVQGPGHVQCVRGIWGPSAGLWSIRLCLPGFQESLGSGMAVSLFGLSLFGCVMKCVCIYTYIIHIIYNIYI